MAPRTHGRWQRVRSALVAVGLALTLCVPLAASVGAASADSEVRIEGHNGVVLIGSPQQRTAELRVPGREPIRIASAHIQVTRSRVYIAARDAEHTITGFSDRKTTSGKIGVLTRIPGYDYARRDLKTRLRQQAEQWRATRVTVTNEKPRLAASSRESK